MSGLLSPKELNEIIIAAEDAKMDEERKERAKQEKHTKELADAFMARDLHPEVRERLNRAVKIAAEQGRTEVQVLTFPSKYCNDGGRSINNGDPDWPQSLEGFAKRAYEFYDKELRPLGYKISAQIINFPGGVPGDVGLFLKW
jgi:hypothetical protein